MAGLCWMVVMLVVFMSAENNMAAVDNNMLARIVDDILGTYGTKGMFSLAVRIPLNQNQGIQEVFKSDAGGKVRKEINNVYVGSRVVAATQNKGGADHVESRVLDNLDKLPNNQTIYDSEMLLFYVYASPCVEKCSNTKHNENILQRIKSIERWNSYAFVFSKIFTPTNGPINNDQQRIKALKQLGRSIGRDNIFRCDGPRGQMQCTSCFSGNQVAHYCVSDDTSLSTLGNTNSNFGQGGRRRSKRNINHKTGEEVSSPQYGRANVEDESSSQVSPDEGNGNDDSNTGESVSTSQSGPDDSNGNDLKTAENTSSSQSGLDFGFGNFDVETAKGGKGKRVKGRRGKGKGVKGRRGKGKGVKGRRGKGKGVKGRRGRGGKCRGSRRGRGRRGKVGKRRGSRRGRGRRGRGGKRRGRGRRGRG